MGASTRAQDCLGTGCAPHALQMHIRVTWRTVAGCGAAPGAQRVVAKNDQMQYVVLYSSLSNIFRAMARFESVGNSTTSSSLKSQTWFSVDPIPSSPETSFATT